MYDVKAYNRKHCKFFCNRKGRTVQRSCWTLLSWATDLTTLLEEECDSKGL